MRQHLLFVFEIEREKFLNVETQNKRSMTISFIVAHIGEIHLKKQKLLVTV